MINYYEAKRKLQIIKSLEAQGHRDYGQGKKSSEFGVSKRLVYQWEQEGILEIVETIREDRIVSLNDKGWYAKRQLEQFQTPKSLLDVVEDKEITKIQDVEVGHRYIGSEKTDCVIIPKASYNLYRLKTDSYTYKRMLEKEVKELVKDLDLTMGW